MSRRTIVLFLLGYRQNSAGCFREDLDIPRVRLGGRKGELWPKVGDGEKGVAYRGGLLNFHISKEE